MSKTPRNPNGPTLAASNDKPATPIKAKVGKPVAVTASGEAVERSQKPMPEVSFSPELLSKLLNEVTEQRKLIAELLADREETKEYRTGAAYLPGSRASKAVTATMDRKSGPGPKLSVAGKTQRSLRNEIDTVKAFQKAGFKNVKPHVNVKTFNRWVAEGRRPIEGSKSLTVANLRLFHVTQTREITAAEKAKAVEQQKAAIDRHNGKASNVTPLNPQ